MEKKRCARIWTVAGLSTIESITRRSSPALGARPLRFASEEDLQGILGLRGGAVSPFGVLNDTEGKVQVVLDAALRDWPAVGVHPNDNTATLRVPLSDLLALFEDRAVPYRFVATSEASAQ